MAWGGTLSFARLVAGLIRVKVVALALGVGGVGIFSLLQQVNLTGVSLVTMSLAVPIINLGRPWVKDGTPKAAGRIAGTALALVVLNGLILILVAAMAGGDLFRELAMAPSNRCCCGRSCCRSCSARWPAPSGKG